MELVQRRGLDMEVLKYNIKRLDKIVVFEFELSRNLEPSDLSTIKLPDPARENMGPFLVVLSGKGPIWLYGLMVHHFHPCKAIAIFDPRFDGGIVIESHSPEFKIGEVVKI